LPPEVHHVGLACSIRLDLDVGISKARRHEVDLAIEAVASEDTRPEEVLNPDSRMYSASLLTLASSN